MVLLNCNSLRNESSGDKAQGPGAWRATLAVAELGMKMGNQQYLR